MNEVWKDIDGFEGRYQVSSFGNVKSLNYRSTGKPKNLTPKLNCKGYYWVALAFEGKQKCVLIHRLVADAFIHKPDDAECVNHKDENPKNNRVENLEWCTQSYNVQYSLNKHPGRNSFRRNRKSGIPYKYRNPIIQLSLDDTEVKMWDNIAQACAAGKWRTTSVRECCDGKRKTAYGFKWRYAI